ncbi:hypothetical protein Pint_26917 [Pistacia integerrima]|uniref:Uncharacterized protein n=1 Tax=Pistacia integerrima TaxID=434235 RepID=A0ACC0YR56_9ROSI|nr:hypothetical protein Pint_26917 [Pistacia integerrima]
MTKNYPIVDAESQKPVEKCRRKLRGLIAEKICAQLVKFEIFVPGHPKDLLFSSLFWSFNYFLKTVIVSALIMDAEVLQKLQDPTWIGLDKFQRKPSGSVRFSPRIREIKRVQVCISAHLQSSITSNWNRPLALVVSCTCKGFPGGYFRFYHVSASTISDYSGCGTFIRQVLVTHSYNRVVEVPRSGEFISSACVFIASILESGGFHAPLDETLILKNKSQEIEPYLDGRCIYLVGMMGFGKTTVGKLLSRVLGYSFVDSDTLVEKAVGEINVADIFRLYGEGFFRDKELML